MDKSIDMTGQTFGQWIVLFRAENEKDGTARWHCRCLCGTEKDIRGSSLRQGKTTMCRKCSNKIKSINRNKTTYRDLTGQRFGRWTVVSLIKKNQTSYWKCQCDCGNEGEIWYANLLSGASQSCGCLKREVTSERCLEDLRGQRYGRWTVIKQAPDHIQSSGKHQIAWYCKCDCGKEGIVTSSLLKSRHSLSCGCFREEHAGEARLIDLTDTRFGLLFVKSRADNKGQRTMWNCVCDCGNKCIVGSHELIRGQTNSCGCLKQSKMELYVVKYFSELGYEYGIDYESQKTFENLTGFGDRFLSYDFILYYDNEPILLIECQGEQHYKPVEYFGGQEKFEKQKLHDEKKRLYADSLGIQLLEIPFYECNTYEEVKNFLINAGIN